MSELKPCPFCGGEGDVEQVKSLINTASYQAACSNEDCCAYQFLMHNYPTKRQAIKAWNTRADDWRPIETAPKDGRALLAWNGNPLNYVWMVCWAEEGGWFIPSCGRDGQTHGGYFSSPQFSPTHWKPLPEPPQENTHEL